jgi:hypothetical protein
MYELRRNLVLARDTVHCFGDPSGGLRGRTLPNYSAHQASRARVGPDHRYGRPGRTLHDRHRNAAHARHYKTFSHGIVSILFLDSTVARQRAITVNVIISL